MVKTIPFREWRGLEKIIPLEGTWLIEKSARPGQRKSAARNGKYDRFAGTALSKEIEGSGSEGDGRVAPLRTWAVGRRRRCE